MLEIINREPITWHSYPPKTARDFPCMLRCGEMAKVRLTGKLGPVRLNLSVCQECSRLEPGAIMEIIKE